MAVTREERQQLVADWTLRCFGEAAATDPMERAARLVEEVIELAQAVGFPETGISALAADVYAKEPGHPFQEVGGVSITLLAFCEAYGIDVDQAEFAELRRILGKSRKHFQARQNAKADRGVALRVAGGAQP